jgi:hypothetical protein
VRLPGLKSPPSAADERLCGLLAALAPWLKREGRFLWMSIAIIAAALLWREGRMRRWPVVAGPGLLLMVAFGAFHLAVGTLPDPFYLPATAETFIAHLDRAGVIATAFAHTFLDLESWSLLWPGAALAGVLLVWREARLGLALSAALLLPLPAYAAAFVLSAWPELQSHLDLALSRLILQLVPITLLLIGLAVPRLPSRPPA